MTFFCPVPGTEITHIKDLDGLPPNKEPNRHHNGNKLMPTQLEISRVIRRGLALNMEAHFSQTFHWVKQT
jgi:phage replication-related protein YjqB (UPF0714/DUF867 family)